jgi:hypothetical protein
VLYRDAGQRESIARELMPTGNSGPGNRSRPSRAPAPSIGDADDSSTRTGRPITRNPATRSGAGKIKAGGSFGRAVSWTQRTFTSSSSTMLYGYAGLANLIAFFFHPGTLKPITRSHRNTDPSTRKAETRM